MTALSTQLAGVALLGLLAVPLFLAPIRARADTRPTDRHEIPTFVRERVEIVTGAAGAACPLPCGWLDGPARCASQVPEPVLAASAGPPSEPPAGGPCGINRADR